MDESKAQILQAMARLMLQFCTDGVASISLHADVEDGMPYMYAKVWGTDPGHDKPLYEWFEFPEGVDE